MKNLVIILLIFMALSFLIVLICDIVSSIKRKDNSTFYINIAGAIVCMIMYVFFTFYVNDKELQVYSIYYAYLAAIHLLAGGMKALFVSKR